MWLSVTLLLLADVGLRDAPRPSPNPQSAHFFRNYFRIGALLADKQACPLEQYMFPFIFFFNLRTMSNVVSKTLASNGCFSGSTVLALANMTQYDGKKHPTIQQGAPGYQNTTFF
jgi:hypothetical protein